MSQITENVHRLGYVTGNTCRTVLIDLIEVLCRIQSTLVAPTIYTDTSSPLSSLSTFEYDNDNSIDGGRGDTIGHININDESILGKNSDDESSMSASSLLSQSTSAASTAFLKSSASWPDYIRNLLPRYRKWWFQLLAEDPFHVLIETVLILFLVFLIIGRRRQTWRARNEDKLSEAETDQLLKEWKEHGRLPLAAPSISVDGGAVSYVGAGLAGSGIVVQRIYGSKITITRRRVKGGSNNNGGSSSNSSSNSKGGEGTVGDGDTALAQPNGGSTTDGITEMEVLNFATHDFLGVSCPEIDVGDDDNCCNDPALIGAGVGFENSNIENTGDGKSKSKSKSKTSKSKIKAVKNKYKSSSSKTAKGKISRSCSDTGDVLEPIEETDKMIMRDDGTTVSQTIQDTSNTSINTETDADAISTTATKNKTNTSSISNNNATSSNNTNNNNVNTITNNNYIKIRNDPVKDATRKALSIYGCGSCGPRGFYGTIDAHLDLESTLASFTGTEASVLYSDGAAASSSTVAAFAKRGDLLVVDEGVHEPLASGVNLSRANVRYFRHNDMDDLRRVLERVRATDKELGRRSNDQRRFIVVEGLYKNHGTICPLDELLKLKVEFRYRLILDESFSFGSLGPTGRGALEHHGLKHMIDAEIVTISLENALGSVGGVTVGNEEVADHQRLSGAGYCFSASSPPFLAYAAIASLNRMKDEPDLLARLKANVKHLYVALDRLLSPTITTTTTTTTTAKATTTTTISTTTTPSPSRRLVVTSVHGISPIVILKLALDDGPNAPPPLSRDEQIVMLDKIADLCLDGGVAIVSTGRHVHRDLHKVPSPALRMVAMAQQSGDDIEKAVEVLGGAMANILS